MLKSWKTTLLGLSTIVAGVAMLLKGNTQEALVAFTTGAGLIFAKDHDVTNFH